jgi:hypothetical protein
LQAKGSLSETSLRSLLESAQSERATGTLTVRSNGAPSTLYFLFGHLFHATGGDGATGDEAVVKALSAQGGEFDFDARAKLPADETVRGSIPELLDRASQVQQTAGEPEQAFAGMPSAAQPPAPSGQQNWGLAAPGAPAYYPPSAPSGPAPEASAGSAPAVSPESSGRPEIMKRVTPRYGREPVPVPHGQVQYDSLKSSFVDFPRLITTQERDRFTGYIRLLTDEASGLIFFRDGRVLECVFDRGNEPTVELSMRGLRSLNEAVSSGDGVLDVVSLSAELVDGLYQLTTSDPIYTELYASWVNPRGLLEFLANRKLTGTVMVLSKEAIGVILLSGGDLAGAYTSQARDIADSPDEVLALCEDKDAMIEVKATDDAQPRPLNVEEVIGPRRGPSAAPAAPHPSRVSMDPDPLPDTPRSFAAPPPAALPGQTSPASPLPTPTPVQPGQQPDWDAVVGDLQQYSEESLGTRARKVKEALAASDRSREGIEQTINQIPQISILFVDQPRLEQLAEELRQRLRTHLGE